MSPLYVAKLKIAQKADHLRSVEQIVPNFRKKYLSVRLFPCLLEKFLAMF